MDERPVEELIGWHMWRTGGPEWTDSDGGRHYRAEVDDMLEWLRANDIDVWMQAEDWDCSYTITHVPVRISTQVTEFEAPTMRQALEAVVRAVAPEVTP